jgi:hypothetical protein
LWLIGSDWWKVPFDDKCRHSFNMAATAPTLDFISVHYLTNAWVDWSDYFCTLLRVTAGRFFSMTSAITPSRWPPREPSLIWFSSIIWQMPQSTGYLHLVGIHDIPHHPTLPFRLISNVTTYRSGAYATPGVALVF